MYYEHIDVKAIFKLRHCLEHALVLTRSFRDKLEEQFYQCLVMLRGEHSFVSTNTRTWNVSSYGCDSELQCFMAILICQDKKYLYWTLFGIRLLNWFANSISTEFNIAKVSTYDTHKCFPLQ